MNFTFLIVFIECCEALRLQVMFASLQQCTTLSRNIFLLWFIQTGIQNVFEQLVCVEAGSKQCRIILKLLCDHRFRPEEVCRTTDYLYFAAKSLFLTLVSEHLQVVLDVIGTYDQFLMRFMLLRYVMNFYAPRMAFNDKF